MDPVRVRVTHHIPKLSFRPVDTKFRDWPQSFASYNFLYKFLHLIFPFLRSNTSFRWPLWQLKQLRPFLVLSKRATHFAHFILLFNSFGPELLTEKQIQWNSTLHHFPYFLDKPPSTPNTYLSALLKKKSSIHILPSGTETKSDIQIHKTGKFRFNIFK